MCQNEKRDFVLSIGVRRDCGGLPGKSKGSRLGVVLLSVVVLLCLLSLCRRWYYLEVSCPSDDPKIIALYKANNRLNKAIFQHDWKWVHNELDSGYRAGVCAKPESYHLMVSRLQDSRSSYAIYRTRMNSYTLRGDTAVTLNCHKTWLLFPPLEGPLDTAYHYWIYSKGEWYLDDWWRFKRPDPEISPETKELMKKLYPEDSLRWQ
jgi:hypothetical protein